MSSNEDLTILLTMTSTYTISTSLSSTPPVGITTITSIYTKQLVTLATRTSTSTQSLPSPSQSTSYLAGPSVTASTTSNSTSNTMSNTTSNVPSPLAMPEPKKVSNSLTLGLSIGIPVAIVSLFVLVLVGLFMYKRTKSSLFSPQNDKMKSENPYLQIESLKNHTTLESSLDHKPQPLNLVQDPSRSLKRQSIMYYVKDRLSRHFKDDDLELGSLPKAGISPMLLKKFKLRARENGLEGYEDTGPLSRSHKLNLVSIVSEEKPSKQCMVKRPYTKKLADELSVEVGDFAVLLAEYSDGWCRVRRGDVEGMVPQVCLTSL
ncbi:uncharacterized protein CANTADRAFT_23055 [Suhomyces tanzawaensis NRRL Y-17324]|uniref:SH3 domain-containing protein n=1 Tax=Suhomyces tanzawaensis NRRL Y-17324 TaxID=984487 RepID=A0A1E4SEI5_9ASCO|nr:uncharacterized protein CANTADRAFT_23055 [Suhomyces tanzawaensis NRRL Y-17324]ODV77939.1 hypothetical protein CANTADRAFT_23055 [Suhomyces tanzawaensis NRRL Y-17324]